MTVKFKSLSMRSVIKGQHCNCTNLLIQNMKYLQNQTGFSEPWLPTDVISTQVHVLAHVS